MRVQPRPGHVVVIMHTSVSLHSCCRNGRKFLARCSYGRGRVEGGGGARGSGEAREKFWISVLASSTCLHILQKAVAVQAETTTHAELIAYELLDQFVDSIEMAGNFGWISEDFAMMDEMGGEREEVFLLQRQQFRSSTAITHRSAFAPGDHPVLDSGRSHFSDDVLCAGVPRSCVRKIRVASILDPKSWNI